MTSIIELCEKQIPEHCYVFKHSTRCPISIAADGVVSSVELPYPVYRIKVIEQRDVSTWISQSLGVEHQSPQLIKVEQGKPVRVWSHQGITAEALTGDESK